MEQSLNNQQLKDKNVNKEQAQAIIDYIDAKVELSDMRRAHPEQVDNINIMEGEASLLREKILDLSQS